MQPKRAAFVGVDVGTASARACIVDGDGVLLAHTSHGIQHWQSQPGWYEQSTVDIWDTVCACVREALADAAVDSSTIKGIGFAATCSLAVFMHDTDEPVSMTAPSFDVDDHNVILWMDERAADQTKVINATKHPLLQYLGGSMSSEMALPKVLWLQKHIESELFSRCQFYDLSDALDHLATGEKRRPCNCLTSGEEGADFGIDGIVKGWQRDFFASIGLDILADDDYARVRGVCKHGRPSRPGSRIGALTPTAAASLNLPADIAVASGVIDAFAGWIGTVGAQDALLDYNIQCDPQHRIAAVAGTSTCFLACAGEPGFVPGIWGPYKDFLIPGLSMAEGGQPATGKLLDEIISTHPFGQQGSKVAQAANLSVFDYLNAALARMQSETSAPHLLHLVRHSFHYLDTDGNRTPIASASMAPSVTGPFPVPTPESLALHYLAALEFLALQTRQIVAAMNGAGYEIRSIFVSGGQSRNPVLMQLMADACAMPVVLVRGAGEAVGVGAAVLAAVAAGDGGGEDGVVGGEEELEGSRLWEVMKRFAKVGRVYRPSTDERLKALLEVKYKVFLEQCERQRVWRSMVDDVA